MGLIQKYEAKKNFTQNEAWRIYKFAAWSEAFGWTILISALLIRNFRLSGRNIVLPIAGQIHGSLFIAYFIIVIAIYPSLGWKRIQSLFALLAGIPPYGSIIFEFYASRTRRYKMLSNNKVSLLITHKGNTIIMQPSKGIRWQLPTLSLEENETAIAGAKRLIETFFGLKMIPKKLDSYSTREHVVFTVDDAPSIFNLDLIEAANRTPYVEEFALCPIDEIENNLKTEIYYSK